MQMERVFIMEKEDFNKKLGRKQSKLTRYSHSRNAVYRAILAMLDAIDTDNVQSSDYGDVLKLYDLVLDLMVSDSSRLSAKSRMFFVSEHWSYMVNDPYIVDTDNYGYSPYYQYALDDSGEPVNLGDQFGEMAHLDVESDGSRKARRSKVCPDIQFNTLDKWRFGSAWNDEGYPTKFDKNGRPVLDGWSKSEYDKLDNFASWLTRNGYGKTRNRVQLFLSFHTLDSAENVVDGVAEHLAAHAHGFIQTANAISRFTLMQHLDFDFDFYISTFNWLATSNVDHVIQRGLTFLRQLNGAVKNYQLVSDKHETLLYLVHDSRSAVKADKPSYRPSWVFSWLPEQPDASYSSISGAWDDTPTNLGDQAIVNNLHSAINQENGAVAMVGRTKNEHKRFTIRDVMTMREVASANRYYVQPIVVAFMNLVYSKRVEITDFWDLLRCAVNQDDYIRLTTMPNSSKKPSLTSLYDKAAKAYVRDKQLNGNVHKQVFMVLGQMGGTGKSRLAAELARYYDCGREPLTATHKTTDLTFDPFQDYAGQRSVILDEVAGNDFSLPDLKGLLDPYSKNAQGSRYNNVSLWNAKRLFLTAVYSDGLTGYVKDVLAHAPGATNGGYLEKVLDVNGKPTWQIKTDEQSQQRYMSDFTQLSRRLGVLITVNHSKTATQIVVSIRNAKDADAVSLVGNSLRFVHTKETSFRVNYRITDAVSADKMAALARKIAKCVDLLQAKANKVYEQHGTACFIDDYNCEFIDSGETLGLRDESLLTVVETPAKLHEEHKLAQLSDARNQLQSIFKDVMSPLTRRDINSSGNGVKFTLNNLVDVLNYWYSVNVTENAQSLDWIVDDSNDNLGSRLDVTMNLLSVFESFGFRDVEDCQKAVNDYLLLVTGVDNALVLKDSDDTEPTGSWSDYVESLAN